MLRPGPGVLLTVALALVLGTAAQGFRGLYRPDEGRYTAIALEMLRTGDWMHPQSHPEQPHYEKPPLTFWLLALSFAAFGESELAARLPNALALLGTLAVLWAAGRRCVPNRPWLAPTLYAISVYPQAAANFVTADTLLTLFTTLAGASFVHWRLDDGRPRLHLLLMWAALGLGFLTKGPPALLPLLAIGIFTCWQDGPRALARLFWLPALVAFLALGAGWYVAVTLTRPGLAGWLLEHEFVGRIFTGEHRRNANLWFVLGVYLPLLVLGSFPWVLHTARGLITAVRGAGDRSAVARRFLLCWVALPTVVFFVASSRLPLYLLQVFPPLMLLAAAAAPPTLLATHKSAWALALWSALGITLMVTSRWIPFSEDTRQLAAALTARAPFAPREVIFFRNPHLGLHFYLGCEVEELGLERRLSDGGEPLKGLGDELAERPEKCLFLIDTHARGRFLSEVARLHADMVGIGTVGDYDIFTTGAEVSGPR
jgi:4-amino-4-deoxy-L-arabinose transferase